jgi:MFS family permease
VSSFQGGAILGTMITFVTADRLGRKRTIALGGLLSTIGCALQAGAANLAMLIVGRFIAGVAIGILTSTIPMYAGEIAEPKYRGALSGLLQWTLSWASSPLNGLVTDVLSVTVHSNVSSCSIYFQAPNPFITLIP